MEKHWNFTKAQRISCVIILVLMILVPCISIYITQEIVRQQQEKKEVGLIQPTSVQMGQDILIEEATLRITSCKEMKEWKEDAPAGFSLLLVSYESNGTGVGLIGFDTDVYFKLPTNEYIEPLSEYRVADELEIDREELVEIYGMSDEIRDDTKSFVFLVPNSVEQGALEIYYIPQIGNNEVLDSIYEIAMEWGE
uniref:hypothetical protein n=1 Tax=Acetatifactor sp. TaxID=1872090 RepID=UPI004056819D